MIKLFATNPFYVLGLDATADQRALRRVVEERSVAIQLGLVGGLSAELLRSFSQVLEEPRSRASAEVFALHTTEPTGWRAQLPLLRDKAQAASGFERSLLEHDVAVAAHLAWAHAQESSPPATEALQLSLAAWRPVFRSKEFWEYQAMRSGGGATADDLRHQAIEALATSVGEVVASLLADRQLGPCLDVVHVLRGATIPGDAIERTLNEVMRDIRGDIVAAAQRLTPAREGTVEDARLDEVALVNEVLGPCRRLVLMGLPLPSLDDVASAVRAVCVRLYNTTYDPFVTVALLEVGADAIETPRLTTGLVEDRATVLRLHHQERAFSAWQAGQWAVAAAHASLAIDVSGPDDRQSLQTIIEKCKALALPEVLAASLPRARAPFEAEKQAVARRVEGAANFDYWSGEGRAYTNPSATPLMSAAPRVGAGTAAAASASAQSQRRKWIAGAALAGLLLLAWANGSSAGTSGSSRTTAPTAPARTSAPTFFNPPARPAVTIAPCVADLSRMRSEIDASKSRLSSMESDLNAMKSQLATLKAAIQSTELLYPNGIPSSIYPTYSSNVDRYNQIVRQYNSELSDYSRLLSQSNGEVDSYNALLSSCR